MEMDSAVIRIVYNLSIADQRFGWYGKMNSSWRKSISECCTNVLASTLRRAFEIRYGLIIEGCEQPLVQVNTSNHEQWETMEEDSNNPQVVLDHDIMEEVLRRLPLPSLMRAKTICKAWNRAISSSNFNVANEAHHFVTQQSCHGITFFCAALSRWFPMPLPWNIELYLCAAADGLFLFLDIYYRPVIFNLLTRNHRFLPSPQRQIDRTAVELIVMAGQFKIVAVDVYEKFQLYDSSTDEWNNIATKHQIFGPDTHYWRSTLHNGVAYFTNNFGRHLGCYDIARREFNFMEIKEGVAKQMDYYERRYNFYASLPSLVACNGKLLLVGRLLRDVGKGRTIYWGRFPFIEHTFVGIWELDSRVENNGCWSLISVIPQDLLEDTVKSSHGTDFVVAASPDKIWLTIKGSANLLTLNLSSMEWSVLPGYFADDLIDCTPRRAIWAPFRISPSLSFSSNPH